MLLSRAGVTLSFSLLLPMVIGRASISENEYRGVVVAVSPEEVEDPALVEAIKELFTSASAELYGATRQRAFFKEVTILVPQSWSMASAEPSVDETFEDAEFRVGPPNPVYGHNPYTVQNRDCGDPGDFIHLSSWFVLNHANNATTEFGRRDKVIVHEWAKLRWGVFEEFGYPGDERFPMFYFQTTWGPNGQEDVLKPNFCTSTEVEGEPRDVVTGGDCSNDPDSGLPDSHCYFFPSVESTVASSYMALPFLDSVTDFCDQTETNLHHAEIPTKHNLYCDGRSTWDVIKEHDDFDDELNPTNPNIKNTTPVFRVVQSKKPKYVVLMDVSTSMETPGNDQLDLVGVRSENLKNAVKRWVMYEVTDGTEVALVVFSNVVATTDPIIFYMASVNDETRKEMVQAVDNMEFDGLTCIGCGIDRALNWEGALKGVNGGVIILITDGKQECEVGEGNSTVCKTIEGMTPQVLERQTRVVTIAFGLEADPALEDLALQSGGKSYFIDDYSGPGSINDAFTGSMTYQPGNVLGESTTTVHQHDRQDVTAGETVTDFFDIDVSIGREVSFQITINAVEGKDCQVPLTITLLKPDEVHNAEINGETFTCNSTNYKTYRHIISFAEEGRWVYKIVASEALLSISVKVESKSREPSEDPVMTRCWISSDAQDLDTTTNVKLAVVAEVSQGSKPVVGARVEAIVERPMDSNNDPQAPIEMDLLDNGVNGGFIGAKVFPKVPDPHSPLCCGSDAMPPGSLVTPTGNFSRHAAGGAFRVKNDVDPSVDNFPPGKVTDLAVSNLDNAVNLWFTSPGDDLDSNDPVAGYTIKYSSTAGNLTGSSFDNEEFNGVITVDDLLDSDLTPVSGGTVKEIKIDRYLFTAEKKYAFALVAADEAGNRSPVSNAAQLLISPAKHSAAAQLGDKMTTTCVVFFGIVMLMSL